LEQEEFFAGNARKIQKCFSFGSGLYILVTSTFWSDSVADISGT
jgi:hypothetical protein